MPVLSRGNITTVILNININLLTTISAAIEVSRFLLQITVVILLRIERVLQAQIDHRRQ